LVLAPQCSAMVLPPLFSARHRVQMDDVVLRRRRWIGLAFASGAAAVVAKEAYEWSTGHPGALDVRSLSGACVAIAAAVAAFALGSGGARQELPARKPVLAVDLDECLGGYLPAFIKFSNATFGTRLELDDFTSYMFWQVPKAELEDREAATERVYAFHASEYFDQIEPFSDARAALGVLLERFELHVVTSRQADIEPQTREWVAAHFPGVFTELHFGNHFGRGGKKTSKPEMCARIGAVALIDDSLDYARQCAEAGLCVFLFGEYAWNQTSEPLPPLVVRLHTWHAATRVVTPASVQAMRR